MNDPKRWSDGLGEGTLLEAELLRSARNVRLADVDRQAIWSRLASELVLGASVAVAPSAAKAGAAKVGASATRALGLGKSLLVTTVVVALGASSYAWVRPAPQVVTDVGASHAMSVRVQAPPDGLPIPLPTAPSTPAALGAGSEARRPSTGPPGSSARVSTAASMLRDESLAILAARHALRSGDLQSTLARLEAARVRYPHGVLVQEREALTVEALGRSGAKAQAERRARTFLKNHPESPYAADVKPYAGF